MKSVSPIRKRLWRICRYRIPRWGNRQISGGTGSVPSAAATERGPPDTEFEKVVILVETYFREGGIHLQLNHVSRETLIDAQKHPEKYPDLRVRISGFSGYFVRFNKTIQDEVIARTVVRP